MILFIIVFLIDYYLINKRKLKKNKSISEIDYLIHRFKLKKNIIKNRLILSISVINSFIIAFTSAIVLVLPFKIMYLMLIAFVILFGLIYALYEIYGRYLKRKED